MSKLYLYIIFSTILCYIILYNAASSNIILCHCMILSYTLLFRIICIHCFLYYIICFCVISCHTTVYHCEFSNIMFCYVMLMYMGLHYIVSHSPIFNCTLHNMHTQMHLLNYTIDNNIRLLYFLLVSCLVQQSTS